MLKKEQLEQLIKNALYTQSEKIYPPEDMGVKARNAVIAGKKKRALLHDWMFNWKKNLAAAACLAIFAGGITIAFSPGLQVWADEKANSLLNKIRMVMYKEDNGNVITVTTFHQGNAEGLEAFLRNRAKAVVLADYVLCKTLAEAEREAGFKIKTPAYFPDGYGLPERIRVGEYVKNQDGKLVAIGKHDVRMRLDDGDNDSLQKLEYITSEIVMEFKPGLRYEEIKVGNRNARWYESEITLDKDGQKPQQLIERAISWENGGMAYLMNDSTGLSKKELVRIVESIQ
jgi:hypothetical protein